MIVEQDGAKLISDSFMGSAHVFGNYMTISDDQKRKIIFFKTGCVKVNMCL